MRERLSRSIHTEAVSSRNVEYPYVSPEEARKMIDAIGEFGEDYNWVNASVAAGAGHKRQTLHYEQALRMAGLQNNITSVSVSHVRQKLDEWYHKLQRNPAVYDRLQPIFTAKPLTPLVDSIKDGKTMTESLLAGVTTSPHFDKRRPTVFITTHGDQEDAAIQLMNEHNNEINGVAVIAAAPDPWRGAALASMTSNRTLQNGEHYVLVHDSKTAEEYKDIRPRSDAKVLPVGTASDPYFMLHEQQTHEGPLHVGIEFSGKYLPQYDDLIVRFIRSIDQELLLNSLQLTIHTMHHEKTAATIFKTLSERHLTAISNVRLLTYPTLEEAIYTRMLYTRGQLDDKWLAPDVVISKGGEVPLEYRWKQWIAAVFGGGHEGSDIEAGVREGRTVDYRGIAPEFWYECMYGEYNKRKMYPSPVAQSYAVFAPLLIKDPHALDHLLLP